MPPGARDSEERSGFASIVAAGIVTSVPCKSRPLTRCAFFPQLPTLRDEPFSSARFTDAFSFVLKAEDYSALVYNLA